MCRWKYPLSSKNRRDEGKTYQQIAFEIIHAYFDEYTDSEMKSCIEGAYDGKFEDPQIVPVKKAGGAWFMELYHGKDRRIQGHGSFHTAVSDDLCLPQRRVRKIRSASLQPLREIRERQRLQVFANVEGRR